MREPREDVISKFSSLICVGKYLDNKKSSVNHSVVLAEGVVMGARAGTAVAEVGLFVDVKTMQPWLQPSYLVQLCEARAMVTSRIQCSLAN